MTWRKALNDKLKHWNMKKLQIHYYKYLTK